MRFEAVLFVAAPVRLLAVLFVARLPFELVRLAPEVERFAVVLLLEPLDLACEPFRLVEPLRVDLVVAAISLLKLVGSTITVLLTISFAAR